MRIFYAGLCGLVGLSVFLSGCSAFDDCTAPSESELSALPSRLSETGLYASGTHDLAPEIRPYAPAFELWSDGAVKRRFLYLPPGTVIDSTHVDDWQFPRGTRLWKEFSRDGRRVETRLLLKTGDGEADWVGAAYVWSGDDALLTPAGVENVLGTAHDVPAADRCFACHGGVLSRVLGFSAVQLASSAGPLTLDDAVKAGLFSTPPQLPRTLPGQPADQKVLGILHANCGHCHNQRRPQHAGARCYDPQNDIELSLGAASLASFAQTGLARTVVGKHIKPGRPQESSLYKLYTHRGPPGLFGPSQMPPLATKEVDRVSARILEDWITALPE